jgi:gliding motility-associated-like protein
MRSSLRPKLHLLWIARVWTVQALSLVAQPLATNTGVTLALQPGGIVWCGGGWQNNAGGTFLNSGVVYIRGDIRNDDAGQFFVPVPVPGTLILNGGVQTLSGLHPIRTDTVRLVGGGPKVLATPLYVDELLDLGAEELRTQTTFAAVRNDDPAAIVRTTGFVSSDQGGYLERATNRVADYLFPVGGHTPLRYRPVYITPIAATPHRWAVRLANTDPNNENLPRSQRHPDICEINPLYYHYVDRLAGQGGADITCVYDPSDPVKGPIAQWAVPPNQWVPTGAVIGTYPDSWRVPNVTQFSAPYWAFSARNIAASLTASADTIAPQANVTFTAGVIPTSPGLSYTWQPGDGSVLPGGATLVYSYAVPGVYTIRVVIQTPEGCIDTAEVKLVVRPEDSDLFIPNVFTPNGDGINDVWTPSGTGLRSAWWYVYDRWGVEVSRGQSLPITWDGTKQGQPCPEGVYTYILEVETLSGKRFKRAGTVTLIR